MRLIFAFAAAGLIASGGSAAGNPDQKKPADPDQKLICKTDYFVGSKIPKRVCLTRAQWEQGEQDGKDALERRSRFQKSDVPTGGPGH
jgi:hypothetical protein